MDIVERLKSDTLRSGTWADTGNLMLEAAEEIERLRSGGVTAWAVVDKDGKPVHMCWAHVKNPKGYEIAFNNAFSRGAPHRIIRVRIVPDPEEQK